MHKHYSFNTKWIHILHYITRYWVYIFMTKFYNFFYQIGMIKAHKIHDTYKPLLLAHFLLILYLFWTPKNIFILFHYCIFVNILYLSMYQKISGSLEFNLGT